MFTIIDSSDVRIGDVIQALVDCRWIDHHILMDENSVRRAQNIFLADDDDGFRAIRR